MVTEADTCRKFILPKLYEAGWSDEQIAEQRTFTDGRIVVLGDKIVRKKSKRADYILRIRRDFPIAVIEAKATFKKAADGIQQAMDYAETLGLKFAYASNGLGIIEHDYISGNEREIDRFPSPEELWRRYREAEEVKPETEERLLEPYYNLPGIRPRYYQEIAINRAVQAVLSGKLRILITMATGTGKTFVAFQIAWKLWSAGWNPNNDPARRTRILYLADRNVLIDDPKDNKFAGFGDARWKIKGKAVKSREIYFATYQAIARDERRPGLFRKYPPDFFDLIIVDECHRGSARDESNWRDILDYFSGAVQIGMTATPLREDNRDTYRYFGNPIYIYTLRQGIEDGFLAPYSVHRITTDIDAVGLRPTQGQLDRYGREIPDGLYTTKDFETFISVAERTRIVAKHLTAFLKKTDPFAKTIVFCVDQEHAGQMREALIECNRDLVKEYSDYAVRVVSEEGDVGRGHLDRFMDVETRTPTIVTTSKLLSTGVDVPTCKNIVLFRLVGSMTEFKQIIGRGTRVRDDYNKFYFTILDYTGSATRHFADPDFDGLPVLITEEEIDEGGETTGTDVTEPEPEEPGEDEIVIGGVEPPVLPPEGEEESEPRKYYVNGVAVEIVANAVYELDAAGKRLRVVKYTDYTREQLTNMYPSAAELKSKWSDVEERKAIVAALEERGISLDHLREVTQKYDSDPFDLLCHVAFNAPLRTRRERAEMVRKDRPDFFAAHSAEAREILNVILDKYVEYGRDQLDDVDILKVPPIDGYGNITEIADFFGGIAKLKDALTRLRRLVYA